MTFFLEYFSRINYLAGEWHINRSLNATVALSRDCPFGVNTTIELRNIAHPTVMTSVGVWFD
jgi:hypothetical protein